MSANSFKIGWFSTGRDEAARLLLSAVLKEIDAGRIPASISFVFSNRERGEASESDSFFKLVTENDIELINLSSDLYKPDLKSEEVEEWRKLYHREVEKAISQKDADIIVLAGYMLIVSPEFCRSRKLINLHPAKPGGPKGTWQEVVWHLIWEGASETGVMMHLVTEVLDEGPPITYCTFSIKGGDFDPFWERFLDEIDGMQPCEISKALGESNILFRKIRDEGVKREIPLIAATLEKVTKGEVAVEDARVLDRHGNLLEKGYDLTDHIERMLSEQRTAGQ